jgi:hypothetical protein
MRNITDNAEDLMDPDSRGIEETLVKAGELARQLKMTSDATIDSKLLVTTADLAMRKAKRLVQGGDGPEQMTPDEYVTKLIRFMRKGDEGSEGRDDEDGDQHDEALNWAWYGQQVLPFFNKPRLPRFLVGPLSLERRARKVTKRTATLQLSQLQETRPEVLRNEDLAKTQDTLASTCGRILKTLRRLQAQIQERLADEIQEDMEEREATLLMWRHGMRSTGGVDLMRFVTNPWSFQQTVENVFYVSFLVRDGKALLEVDDVGLYSVGE